MIKTICFGECLLDYYPTGDSGNSGDGSESFKKHVGGAPLNVMTRLKSLGAEVEFISSIGKDDDAKLITDFLKSHHISTDHLQVHPNLPTGKSIVHLDENKSATFEIVEPVAWDEIHYREELSNLAKKSDLLIFGSLIFRSSFNRSSFNAIAENARFKVCDLNLRQPFDHKETIAYCLEKTDLLKINEDELCVLVDHYSITSSDQEFSLDKIAKKSGIKQICLTLGKDGSLFYDHGKVHRMPTIESKVIDTVGAGDSFLASFLYQLFSKKDIDYCLAFANVVGGLVAEKFGANPPISQQEVEEKIKSLLSFEL